MIVERQMRGRPVRAKVCVSLLAITAITSVVLDLRADEVELTDGGRVKGKVVVESPQEGVRVLLEDGTTYSVPAALVKKVTYGDLRGTVRILFDGGGEPFPNVPLPSLGFGGVIY